MLENAMAESKKKAKYITKSVKFGGKQFTLFSLDGITWSSRRDELHQILERQEQERKSFNQIMGDQTAEKGAAPDGEPKEAEEDTELVAREDDEILPITTEPARKPIKPRSSIAMKAAKARVSAGADEGAGDAKAMKKKSAKAEQVVAAPKSRTSSKPTKKAQKLKGKKKVA
jgi:hypothetical protein